MGSYIGSLSASDALPFSIHHQRSVRRDDGQRLRLADPAHVEAGRPSWKSCAALGFCLGGALLAKSTALLVLPPIFGALLWKWLEKRSLSPAQWAARMALIMALCALVGGWHYVRLWIDYGSPLIGNSDPELGSPGGRKTAFERALSTSNLPTRCFIRGRRIAEFCDGIYATLWGDGLLGVQRIFFAPALELRPHGHR